MTLLTSIFRTMDALTFVRRPDANYFSAGIGMDLGLRKNGKTVFGNLMSLAPVWIDPENIGDRDRLLS